MELISITLAANETKQFAKAGRYFEIIDAPNAIRVDFTGPNGNLTDTMVNALSGLYLEEPYTHFSISNGAVAQTITLLLMETGRGGSRRQPGNVRVIDQSTDKTLAGKQFIGSLAAPASPGVLSCTGIIGNSALAQASIKRIVVSAPVAGNIVVFRGSGPGTAVAGAGVIQNKKYAGAFSTFTGGGGMAAALPMTVSELPGYFIFIVIAVQANQPVELPMTSPLVMTGTSVLGFCNQAVNSSCSITFDMEEG